MKLSELIKQLQAVEASQGDIDVLMRGAVNREPVLHLADPEWRDDFPHGYNKPVLLIQATPYTAPDAA